MPTLGLSGHQAAEAVRDLARMLNAEANAVLAAQLADPVARIVRAAALPSDLAAVVARWISHGTTMRDLRSGAGRLLRQEQFEQLTSDEQTRLNAALADYRKDAPELELAMQVRQRRRNVSSQVRSVLKPLDPTWLRRQLLEAPSLNAEFLVQRAQDLTRQQLSEHFDFQHWADEVFAFYLRATEALAESRGRLRASTSTARTYRASWSQFWRDYDVPSLLEELGKAGFVDRRMLWAKSQSGEWGEGSEMVHISVHLRGDEDPWRGWKVPPPDLSRSPGGWTADGSAESGAAWLSSALEQQDRADNRASSAQFEALLRQSRTASRSVARAGERLQSLSLAPTGESLTPDMFTVTVRLTPSQQPSESYSHEWQSVEDARYGITHFVTMCRALSDQATTWDLALSYTHGRGTTTINRVALRDDEVSIQVGRLLQMLQELT